MGCDFLNDTHLMPSNFYKLLLTLCRGGGQVVRMRAYYSTIRVRMLLLCEDPVTKVMWLR